MQTLSCAGIVSQNVDTAEPLKPLPNHAVYLIRVGNISSVRQIMQLSLKESDHSNQSCYRLQKSA